VTSDVVARPAPARSSGNGSSGNGVAHRLRSVLRWEAGLVVVLAAVLIYGSGESSTFLTGTTLFNLGYNVGYIAIMAMPMTFIVMTGEIDLSVASMLGLSGSMVGYLWHHGWGIWPAMLVAIVVGVVGGALNGFLVVRVGLPSIAVTIGSLTLYRGIAEILLGSQTIPAPNDRPFPTWFDNLGALGVAGSQLTWSTLFFLVFAVIFGVILHLTSLGRSLYAIGLQPEAAQFTGIRVARIKFWLYVASGVFCAFAGILLTAQNASVTYNAGTGLELNVVAMVLFGGVSIFGGRGTIPGVVLSIAIFATLQIALTDQNVDPNVQNIITGLLLLISVIVPNGGEALRRLRSRLRRPPRRR